MKRKISKILGVGLTLALLVSLMVTAVPAAAADRLYSAVSTPSKIGEVLQAGTDIDFLVAAPDGTTMFAFDNGALLYKSTNAGVTWAAAETAATAQLTGKTLKDIAVSPSYATDSTVVVAATDNIVYISVDGGRTFNAGPALTLGGGNISSLDVGKYYATGVVNALVGLTGSSGNATFRFPLSGAYAWTPVGALTGINVVAVRFSPQHLIDAEILAVSVNATSTNLNTQFGTSAWNANIGLTPLLATATATGAVIAFGSDYIGTGTNTILVGTRGTAVDDVIRVSGLTMGATKGTAVKTVVGTGPDVQSIVVTGPIATATVLAGVAGDVNVYRSTSITATTITWTGSTSDPTGTNPTAMIWAGSAVYAGTTGNDSALSKSTDGGVNFSQVALIDVKTIASMSIAGSAIIDANTMFVIMNNASGNTTSGYAASSLFKTTNGGTSWQRILTATPVLTIVKASPNYATDSALYVSDGSMTLKKSIDGGATFTAVGVPAAVTALAVVDKDTYFAGAATALYKSARWATPTLTGTVKSIALSPGYATDKTLLVGNNAGSVYISIDDGVTFTAVGAAGSLGTSKDVIVCLDPLFATNKTIYAAQSTDNLTAIRRTASTTTTAVWVSIDTDSSNKITGLVVDATSGGLYAASAMANAGIRRSLAPLTAIAGTTPTATEITALGFQSMAAAAPFTLGASAVMKSLAVLSGAKPVLYAITSGMADATTPWGYTDRILTVADTLTVMPALATPLMNATLATTTTAPLVWTAVTGATLYDVWLDTASTFGTTTIKATSATASYSATALTEGKTYYWKVRVATPVQSQWSVYLTFNLALSAPALPTVTLSPVPGAADVSVTPTLVWPAITGATSYDIQITDDPFFITILSYGASLTNTYVQTEPLAYSSTYYWRVRALSSTTESLWTRSTFTTMAEPVEVAAVGQYVCPIDGLRFDTQAELEAHNVAAHAPAAPAAVVYDCPQCGLSFTTQANLQAHWNATHAPEEAEPAIPTYLLWTIILIGAVLLIALIVLIVRTRRVA